MNVIANFANNDFSDIKNAIMPFNVLADNYGETLAAEQLMLEHESYTMGEERFRKALERQIERGEVCDNAVAAPLMDTLIPAIADALEVFLETKQKGRPHVAKAYLSQLSVSSAAYIGLKTVLMILAKEESAPIQRVAMAIGGNIEDEVRFGRIRDLESDHFKNRVKENLDKRAGLVFKKAYMEAVEAGMLEQGQLETRHERWEKDHVYHVGILMIEKMIESAGLLEIEHKFAGIPDKDHQAVHLSQVYVDKLTSRAHALAGISPMHQPMIVPPKPWVGVSGGGYWAAGRRPLNLIRVGSKRALMRYNEVDMPEVYHAVNTIQNTAWRINERVLAVANMVVNWKNCPVSDIPTLDKLELPVKPDDIDTNEVALKGWKKAAAGIYRKERARQSRRLSLEFSLGQANKFAKYDAIYFPHNLDWRGRVYAVPMFNPQGNDMTKGLLHFAKTMPLGKEGAYWLAVHGSNCAGVDKVSLDDRVQWVADNEAMILASAESPLDCTWWAEQDSPFCFLAFCFEWADYVNGGRQESFESSLALAFDGTCSGLQHFSAMLRDEVGGAAVNLTPSEKPQDVYGIVAAKIVAKLAILKATGSEDKMETITDKKTGEITEKLVLGEKTLAAQWLEFGVTRNVTKRSVMTLAYGSKQFGFTDQVREDIVTPAIDAGKGQMFTVPAQACQFMAKQIWDSVSVTVIAAVKAMEWLQKAATLISSEVKDKDGNVVKPALPVNWTTPVGFPVWSEYRIQEQKRVESVLFGKCHDRDALKLKITLNVRESAQINPRKQASGIAPNFVHSMDGSHLMLTAVKGNRVYNIKDFAMIHDSFGCHAGNAHLLFKAVRETMVETYEEHDVIQEFYNEFESQLHDKQLGKMPEMPAKGSLNLRDILESKYTFS